MKRSFIFLAFSIVFAGFQQIQNVAASAAPNDSTTFAEPTPTPNAQQTAQCQNLLRGRRDRINDMGELPADMPLPRGTVLCGFVSDLRATYFINSTLDGAAVAQFYRDALPPQGFVLGLDNPSNGGRFMDFVRGTSETIQIESRLSTGAEFRNMFSVSYMPPSNEHGEIITGTTIMRRGANSSGANATTNPPNGDANNAAAVCGNRNPIGGVKCAIELQKNLQNWQFSLEDKTPTGARQTYAGEFLRRDRQVRIRAVVAGRGRDDGEWWFRLGTNPLLGGDNGSRAYRKEDAKWIRYQAMPDDIGGILLSETAAIGELDSGNATFLGTENLGGESCKHYRQIIAAEGESYPQVTKDFWISARTGFCVRRRTESAGNVRLLNISRLGEIRNIDSPQAEN